MVFVFSGTGNSAYVARRIAEGIGQEVRSINDALAGRGLSTAGIAPAEPLVFVAPTYSWRLPRVVADWIERTDFGSPREAYFVLTCGGEIGNAASYLESLCRRRGLAYRGCAQVVMPDNYIVLFKSPTEEESRGIIARAEAPIDEIAGRIKRGDDLVAPRSTCAGAIKSGPVNVLFNALFVKALIPAATDACVGCGACAALCPLGNVRLEGGRPLWGKNCVHCMACVSGCPQGAVECGKRTQGKQRYRCPVR